MSERCRVAIPRETWAYITILGVVLVGAMMREINLLLILGGLMLGPLLVSWRLVRATLQNLELNRQFPAAVFPGDRLTVEIEVRNRRRRLDSWAVIIVDRIQRVQGDGKSRKLFPRALLPHVAAGASATAEYDCRLTKRGLYRLGPFRLKTRVPLGLLLGYRAVKRTDELTVYPRLGHLTTRWFEFARAEHAGHQSSRRQQGPTEGDFYGLRDWRVGDSRRWIHWRSSAKRNSLLVRQFEQQRNQDFLLLLDLWTGPSSELSADEMEEAVERAVSFAATVIADECRRSTGFLVLGIAGATAQQVRGPTSPAFVDDALQLLAEVRESSTDRLPELLELLLPSASTDDRVAIVSLRPSTQNITRFAELPSDTRQHKILQQAVCVDTSASNFGELFSWETNGE